jgi:FkbM family methyltransferase
MILLTALKSAAEVPFRSAVYPIKHGLARGLKRRGGLGFLARRRPLSPEEQFLDGLDLRGATVYDVGCLDGMYTLFFATRVGPSGHVIAFEPNPANCRAMRANVSVNGFGNVRICDIGLGSGAATGELAVPYGFPGQGTARDDMKHHYFGFPGTLRVPIRLESMDQAIRDRRLPPPDLVKIDVEGFELEVLRGASATLRSARPRVFVELHGLEAADRQRNVRDILCHMRDCGYPPPTHLELGATVSSVTPEIQEGHLWFSA